LLDVDNITYLHHPQISSSHRVAPQPMTIANTASGAAVYGPVFIRFFYDVFVPAFSFTYVWRCPVQRPSAFFTINITGAATSIDKGTHQPLWLLDIGVGMGYSLQHSPIAEDAHVDLVVLRDVTLDAASEILKKAHPTVAFEPC
jgi:hypothetical protein